MNICRLHKVTEQPQNQSNLAGQGGPAAISPHLGEQEQGDGISDLLRPLSTGMVL